MPVVPKKPVRQDNGMPKFGRLLIVLALAVMIVVAVTFGSMAYFS
jgi:hypothetical protein